MAQGRSIRIYLADGSAAGIRHAEVVNWTGQAIVCPRARVSELADWPESQRPGVYMLVGDNPNGPRPLVYVGEAESVYVRLKQHLNDENKEFWDQVVLFTSKDDNLTKSHVKYLEARFVAIAREVNRVSLENGNTPTLSALPRADRDAMEEFLGPTRLLLSALGFQTLQPIAKTKSGPDATGPSGPLASVDLFFQVARRGIKARGHYTDEGFVVLANSVGGRIHSSLTKTQRAIRQALIADGSLVEEGSEGKTGGPQGRKIKFVRDVLFSSPSAAGSMVSGGASNGRKDWKTEEGRTLKELENDLIADKTPPNK